MKEKDFLVKIIKEAYTKYLKNAKIVVKNKGKSDLVTSIDESIEKYLTEQIKKAYPDDIVIAEEFSKDFIKGKRIWTIDPIDGTINFAKNMPFSAIQAAFIEDGVIKVGVIYLLDSKDLYVAEKGKGCYLNGKKLKKQKEDFCIMSFGDITIEELDLIKYIYSKTERKVIKRYRTYGSAAYDFSQVANGKLSGTLIMTRNVWDLCPGAIICEESGSKVISYETLKKYELGDFGILAYNNKDIFNLIKEKKDKDVSC